MCDRAWQPILAALVLFTGHLVVAKQYNLTVGYLPCIMGGNRDRQGITISGALSMAIEEINNSTELLPDVNLLLKWNDTKCDTAIATKLIKDMTNSGVVAFFGPEGHCQTDSIIAQSRNLPMIAYKCYDHQTSIIPNFARLNPPETQAIKSVISLLRFYRWNKFSILYDDSWMSTAMILENYAIKNNMTVNHLRPVVDELKCCEEMMACCDASWWYRRLILETKNSTRIYVFLGSTSGLIEMMTAMEHLQMFEKGEYMVISVDTNKIYSCEDSLKYVIRTEDRGHQMVYLHTPVFSKRAKSLLVVVSSEPESSYEYFSRKVREYNSKQPFNFPQPFIMQKAFVKVVSIYAAYLYDSAKLYAIALHSLIEEDTTHKNVTLTYEKLMSVATNGSRIVSKMIAITPFESVSGMSISLDERKSYGSKFSVLAFKPSSAAKIKYTYDGSNCTYSMMPVGHFQQGTKEFPVYKVNPRLPIDWANDMKPEDEPSWECLNAKGPNSGFQITSLFVAGILAVTLFCALCLIMAFFIIKKIKTRTNTLNHGRTERLLVKN